MKEFESFFIDGQVRKVTQDTALATSLIKDMHSRIDDVNKPDIAQFAKRIFEHMYDAFRDFCDALLAHNGYKTYSHEAAISYLQTKEFDITFITQLDNFRILRNNSKYYGVSITQENAQAILDFYNHNKEKLNQLLENEKLVGDMNKEGEQ